MERGSTAQRLQSTKAGQIFEFGVAQTVRLQVVTMTRIYEEFGLAWRTRCSIHVDVLPPYPWRDRQNVHRLHSLGGYVSQDLFGPPGR